MNGLITALSEDMRIYRYLGESDDSFIFRVCYSALGQWCLMIAQNSISGITGTSKQYQTIMLNDLLKCYSELFSGISDKFKDRNNPQLVFSVHIRRVFEETGFLLTNISNRNQLANYGRNIQVGNSSLFFGFPDIEYSVVGLGIFTSLTSSLTSKNEFIIRDYLTVEEYFQSRFDISDFYEKQFDNDELQFFNPLSSQSPSNSWSTKIVVDYSLARKSQFGPYYRVIKEFDKSMLFADEVVYSPTDNFTSCEYRRLYFALKAHYKNPVKACIIKLDEEYSKLMINGYLPNREYYYLLLISWPFKNAFDKVIYLIKNDFIQDIVDTLENIGIVVRGDK